MQSMAFCLWIMAFWATKSPRPPPQPHDWHVSACPYT